MNASIEAAEAGVVRNETLLKCRWCVLVLPKSELETWVGCDACRDDPEWIEYVPASRASSPQTKEGV